MSKLKWAKIGSTVFIFGLYLNLSSVAQAFEYGQCLLDRSESFSGEIKNYRNVAMAKAAIKRLALKNDESLLRWNYDTARLIYDLNVVRPLLAAFDGLYESLRVSDPDALDGIQEYLSDDTGHLLLAQIDQGNEEHTADEITLNDFLGFLEKETGDGQGRFTSQIESVRKLLSEQKIAEALGDLYDRIQVTSVGATPIEPQTIKQWIELSDAFMRSQTLNGCAQCEVEYKRFTDVMLDWAEKKSFPSLNSFSRKIFPDLPPLLRIKYPELSAESKQAEEVLRFYTNRSLEEFLFDRTSITEDDVIRWMKVDSTYKIILKQADASPETYTERSITLRILKYLQQKERVFNSTFDHFVWSSQTGTDFEKTVDGVARTLYGEAESCQLAGAHQFEAIASVIAARSVSADLESKKNNLFKNILDYTFSAINLLSPVELAPLSKYPSGASDFGRTREIARNPMIAEMPTPARVVSKPSQFSVWKFGKNKEYEAERWIDWPKQAGYPKDLKISVIDQTVLDLDAGQRKVLCPNHEVFKEAVEIASEMVSDYYTFANKYRFYQGQKRVVPYFFTHGPKTVLRSVNPISNPKFVEVKVDLGVSRQAKSEELKVAAGEVNCKSFKVYTPPQKFFDKVLEMKAAQQKWTQTKQDR